MRPNDSKQFPDQHTLEQHAPIQHANDQHAHGQRALDTWLDIALKQHRSEGPDAEMEARLLRLLRAIPQKSSRSNWRLVLAAASVCALILIAVLVSNNRRPRGHYIAVSPARQQTLAANNVATPTAPMANARGESASGKKPRHTVASHVAAQVWPLQFPTPRPLSQQEQLLARYVHEQPQQAQFVARARSELLKQTLAEFEARDHDRRLSSALE